MSMGMGLTIPNISNLPGVSRPGSGVQTDKYSLNFRTNSADPTLGDGTLSLNIQYRIVKFT